MNEDLKEMGQKAELNNEVVLTFTKAGKKVTETSKKQRV